MKQLFIWQFFLGLIVGYLFLGRIADFIRSKLASV